MFMNVQHPGIVIWRYEKRRRPKRNVEKCNLIYPESVVEEQENQSRLAQLVERETVNLEASGSIPLVRA